LDVSLIVPTFHREQQRLEAIGSVLRPSDITNSDDATHDRGVETAWYVGHQALICLRMASRQHRPRTGFPVAECFKRNVRAARRDVLALMRVV
jgi:hypothetical protein